MTKEALEMKRFPGVRTVPGSTNWPYVKKVPADLSEHPEYKGKQWASCFSIFDEESMAPCSWCGDVNAGKPNNDFRDGCVVCYGSQLPDDD